MISTCSPAGSRDPNPVAANRKNGPVGPRTGPGGLLLALLAAGFAAACGVDDSSGVGSEDAGFDPATDVATDVDEDGSDAASGHAELVAELWTLLPGTTRGALALDVGRLLAGDSADQVAALLAGEGGDPALAEFFGAIAELAVGVDVAQVMSSAVLAQTTDASQGLFLLAALEGETFDEVASEPPPARDGSYGPADRELYLDADGNQLALLPGGVLVAGQPSVVRAVIDRGDGGAPADASALEPFRGALDPTSPFAFAYALPAHLDGAPTSDRTLRGAAAVTGALTFSGGAVSGDVTFHTANASDFVDAYNELNRNAVLGDDPIYLPLRYEEPIAAGLGRVVVPIPATPLDRPLEEVVASRNTLKLLFVGMEAHDYAEEVGDPGNAALVDLVVLSEQDPRTPPSPGSVFIRWEFRDQQAIDDFEANELPAGFALARTRFFESDDPEGEYFLALNLYNAGGGSIVNGARAEWDVFVDPPEGADPEAGARPRFMVVDALAEAISADPVNLVTPAEPLSHAFVGDRVVTTVARYEAGEQVDVFESSFPRVSPDDAEVARFTRQMAIGNDFIYWGHGVHDRVLYNATTFNHDAYFVDPAEVVVQDDSPWAQYLSAEIKDVVYYVNTLEYVVSPMANLRSELLDVTPEWLEQLIGFKTNGHQLAMMRNGVEQLFRGTADALVPRRLDNATPATFFSFEITDPESLAAALELPPGYELTTVPLFDGDPAGSHLTLAVFETGEPVGGLRAEWRVFADDGRGRARTLVIDWQTEEVAVDPVRIVNLPSGVRHELTDGVVRTRIASSSVAFEASFGTAGATDETLSLDWIESGDAVCYSNGICDEFYYDAQTLDVPVHQPASVTVDVFETPWDEFLETTSPVVFYRDNAQEQAVKRWHNLRVVVPELPFDGLTDPTHEISGAGTLAGRTSNVVDSEYSYSGDAALDGDQLTFAIDQEITNLLGNANIYTAGSFDLVTGVGTQTVTGCVGPPLMCSGIESGTTSLYEAQNLDASDRDAITWQVDVVVDLGGSFGLADSASTFTASRAE